MIATRWTLLVTTIATKGRAYDTVINRIVAVKLLPPQLAQDECRLLRWSGDTMRP
jgi:hypothetical protein